MLGKLLEEYSSTLEFFLTTLIALFVILACLIIGNVKYRLGFIIGEKSITGKVWVI